MKPVMEIPLFGEAARRVGCGGVAQAGAGVDFVRCGGLAIGGALLMPSLPP
jgi:hypothetical protein